jgi:uncharacterized repeat protein (TIGR03803 family)
MPSNRFPVVTAVWAIFTAILLMGVPRASAQQERVIHSFSNNGVDGSGPQGALLADPAGNLYGTTWGGGPNGASGCGVVFELAAGTWVENILHTFLGGATDGCHAQDVNLVFDAAYNLYGTSFAGGAYNFGTVYRLGRAAGWKETILHNFGSGSDGTYPYTGLTFDAAGNLYGTTQDNAAQNAVGTVFELRAGTWTENVLSDPCDYCGLTNLVFDKAGNLYTTGANSILQLTRNGNGTWTNAVIFGFPVSGLGGFGPSGNLIFDAAGNLYGTAFGGGAFGWGVVFRLTPVGGQWTETVLYSFKGPVQGGDGAYPYGGVVFDTYGNLYGTTTEGGPFGDGTVFELSPAVPQWKETVLYNFGGFPGDVTNPFDSLILVDGNLFGTANHGGANNNAGGVFEIIR